MKKIWEKTLLSGEKWSGPMGKNRYMKFTAQGNRANVAMLLFNFFDKTEKYNMPDTLKGQHISRLTAGDVLVSDNGRLMAAFTEDDLGWHDTITGYSTKKMIEERYKKTSFQVDSNDFLKNSLDNFKIELTRNGLGHRDLVPCVNLFSKISAQKNGTMVYENLCKPNASVTIKTEMTMLIMLSNTPNALDMSGKYPEPVVLEIFEAPEANAEDYSKCPENLRAYENTCNYYNLLGDAFGGEK